MEGRKFYQKASRETRIQYNRKFEVGKNLLDSELEDTLISQALEYLPKGRESRVLEIGAFTGRVTKKLSLHFEEIFSTETSKRMLDGVKNGLVLDWAAGEQDAAFGRIGYFDFICSLGMNLSISKNVAMGICTFSRFQTEGGVILFDIWNSRAKSALDPSYGIQKLPHEEVVELLKNHGYKLVAVGSSQKIYAHWPRFTTLMFRVSKQVVPKLLSALERQRYLSCFSRSKTRAQGLYYLATFNGSVGVGSKSCSQLHYFQA